MSKYMTYRYIYIFCNILTSGPEKPGTAVFIETEINRRKKFLKIYACLETFLITKVYEKYCDNISFPVDAVGAAVSNPICCFLF